MKLSLKESKLFTDWYIDRYGTVDIIDLPIEKEQEEVEVRVLQINKILGKSADRIYKKRSWGNETVGKKVFNSLWLNYGPRIVS